MTKPEPGWQTALYIVAGIVLLPAVIIAAPFYLIYKVLNAYYDSPRTLVAKATSATGNLYKQAQSIAATFPTREDFVGDVLREVMRDRKLFPVQSVFYAMAGVCGELYEAEALHLVALGDPPLPETIEGARYRDRLINYIERCQDPELVQVAKACIVASFNAFLDTLPQVAFSETTDDDDKPHFAVPFEDVLRKPNISVHELILPFFSRSAYDHGLFKSLREQLDKNLCAVSGLPFSNANRESPKLITPINYSGDDPIGKFLRDTPLALTFQATVPFSIPTESRFKHQWVVGPSGSGKTTLLETQIAWDLERVARGECSIIVVDSQNVLIPKIAGLKLFAPGEPLHGQLTLLEPDPDHILALNLFDLGTADVVFRDTRERHMYEASAAELIQFSLSTMSEQQGELFSYIIQLVMTVEGATIDTFREILQPNGLDKYREELLRMDDTVQAFFNGVFNEPSFKVTKEAVLRRILGMLSNPTFRRMFQSKHNRFRMVRELDDARVILINTDLAYLKKDGCEAFGRFFIAQLLHAMEMRGSGLPVFCYVDEMHDYLAADENLATLLDKARKRNIGLVLAHQRLSNITSPNVLDALSNVDIQFAGGNRTDAAHLAKLMNSSAEEISAQPRGSFMTFVRGKTDRAVKLTVPRVMDDMERMTTAELRQIKTEMHERYCIPPTPIHVPAPQVEHEAPLPPITAAPPTTLTLPIEQATGETDAKPW